MDLEQHLKRQIAFSRATFGPGTRIKGICDHIRKELTEVEESGGHPSEWVDVVILGLDGLWRSFEGHAHHQWALAQACVEEILEKQQRNELRDWPDGRTAEPNSAIEHIKPPRPADFRERSRPADDAPEGPDY